MSDDDQTPPYRRPRRQQSQTDRDLDSLEARRARAKSYPFGVPEFNEDDERTPPPTDFEELVRRLWPIRKLADEVFRVNERGVRHEVRIESLEKLSGGIGQIDDLRTEMIEHIADIKGKSGDNGKIGEVRKGLHSLTKRLWWVVGGALASLLTVAGLIWNASATVTHVDDQIDHLLDRVHRLERFSERPDRPAFTWPPASTKDNKQ